MRSLTPRALASAHAESTDEVWLVLLTLDHEHLAEPIRVVNNDEDIIRSGARFVAWGFDIELPGEDAESTAVATLTIDNVDPVIVKTLRTLQTPLSAVIEVVLASQPEQIEAEFTGLKLRRAVYNDARITGDLAFEDILSEPVATTLSPAAFPGMF